MPKVFALKKGRKAEHINQNDIFAAQIIFLTP